jgi:type II secretory pathway pseudopilin PulG
MILPFTLPSWMPEWLGLVLLLVGLLYALAMLAMPFSVFGVKSRLEAIEEQLDQVQEELRILTLRLPEPLRGVAIDETPYDPLPRATTATYNPAPTRRPPPAAPDPYREPIGRPRPATPPPRSTPTRRIEPRLD